MMGLFSGVPLLYVDHVPLVRLPFVSPPAASEKDLLPVALKSLTSEDETKSEILKELEQQCLGKKVKVLLLGKNTLTDAAGEIQAVEGIVRAKKRFLFRSDPAWSLVSQGFASVQPFDQDQSDLSGKYAAYYKVILHAENKAAGRKVGLWNEAEKKNSLWARMKSLWSSRK